MCRQDDFGDLIANEEAEAAQEEGSHLRSAYQRASRHVQDCLKLSSSTGNHATSSLRGSA